MEPLFFRYRTEITLQRLNYDEQQRWLAHRKDINARKKLNILIPFSYWLKNTPITRKKLKQLQGFIYIKVCELINKIKGGFYPAFLLI